VGAGSYPTAGPSSDPVDPWCILRLLDPGNYRRRLCLFCRTTAGGWVELVMGAMIGFVKGILKMPTGVVIWVALLFGVNFVGVIFLPRIEALVVVAALMLGGIFQSAIFGSKGFVRLMGVGHVLWIPMVAWLLTRFDITAPQGSFEVWMTVVVVFDVLSLIIDVSDVGRYVAGDRQPTI